MKHFSGVIFYELLNVIPAEDRMQHILAARDGAFLQNDTLLQHEKAFLSVLLAPDAADRPSEVQDVIDVTEVLLDNYRGDKSEHRQLFMLNINYLMMRIYSFHLKCLSYPFILGENDDEWADDSNNQGSLGDH